VEKSQKKTGAAALAKQPQVIKHPIYGKILINEALKMILNGLESLSFSMTH